MSLEIKNIYTSASVSRTPQAADVSCHSLVCFATQNLLSLWDLSKTDIGIVATFHGHKAAVNCVKFLKDGLGIISADQNGVVQIRTQKEHKWELKLTQSLTQKPIISLATHENLVVVGSSDAKVAILEFNETYTLKHLQTIDLRGKFPLKLVLSRLPETPISMLCIGTTAGEVNIWMGTGAKFTFSTCLKGHEDWITALSIIPSQQGSTRQLLLASGSQDATIRLWAIDVVEQDSSSRTDEIFSNFELALDDVVAGQEANRVSPKRHIVVVKSNNGSSTRVLFTFDALLVGHEGHITSLAWQRRRPEETPLLLSSSLDSSIIIWSLTSVTALDTPEKEIKIWVNRHRFGDVAAQRFSGFLGALWAPDDKCILGWNWNGNWRRWLSSSRGGADSWEEVEAVTGHRGSVKSVSWAPNGEYIISTGLDQTTRIHGPSLVINVGEVAYWRELARPQIHGYDLLSAEFFNPLRFASIADEKVVRIFDAPKGFVMMLDALRTVPVSSDISRLPPGAIVPPLGLSNKLDSNVSYENTPLRCPFESELANSTLWPESDKIFGHGYELISLSISHSSKYMVTSCKATTPDHAVLRVYNTANWQLQGEPLSGHKLTVTRTRFSPSDAMLLSISRDRTWRLFEADGQDNFQPLASAKAHERIIWDCAWITELAVNGFATASRDKTVKIWIPTDTSLSNWKVIKTLSFAEGVTSIDFSPVLNDRRRRLAVGLEDGAVLIYHSIADDLSQWDQEISIPTDLAHVNTVNRIQWRPNSDKGPIQFLATCSEDGTIKITMVHLNF